jgi:Fe-S-cluster containining protein
MSDPDPQHALRLLHDDVDRRARAIAARHGARLQCRRGCADCCVDDLTVHPIEAERIRRAHPTLLRDGEPHPSGACAFLSAGRECRVYADRPYVCRTQGLPLRWLEEDEAGEVRERRDICPLNEAGPPLATLAESDCWWIGPTELELLRIQEDSGAGERIALRALFKR